MSEEVQEKVKQTIDDASTIAGEVYTITLKDGKDYKIPEFTYKDDANVSKAIGFVLGENPDLLKKISQAFSGRTDVNIVSAVIESLPLIFARHPDLQTQLMCIIAKQDEEWVDKNLDYGEVMVFVPFFLQERPFIVILLNQIKEWWTWLTTKATSLE